MRDEEEEIEFNDAWGKINPERLKSWQAEYNRPEAQKERKRLGLSSSSLSFSEPNEAIIEFSRYISGGLSSGKNDEVYESAIESIAKTIARWVENGQFKKIESLAQAVKKKHSNKGATDCARLEILRIFHHFFRQGKIATEDQIKAKMQFDENVRRSDLYYKKGNFVKDIKAVGLGGIRTRKRGRPSKSRD